MITIKISDLKHTLPFVYNNISKYFNYDFLLNNNTFCRYEIMSKCRLRIRISFLGTFYFRKGKIHRDKNKPAIMLIDGSTYYYKYGKKHSLKYPAVKKNNGALLWYRYGKRHRENGPAVVYTSGTQEYWYNGFLHNENGPAITCSYESENNSLYVREEWFKYGKRHRNDNNPALIYKLISGGQLYHYNYEWYQYGLLHSLINHSVDTYDGKQYYIYGRQFEKKTFQKVLRLVKKFTNKLRERYKQTIQQNINKIFYNDLCVSVLNFI